MEISCDEKFITGKWEPDGWIHLGHLPCYEFFIAGNDGRVDGLLGSSQWAGLDGGYTHRNGLTMMLTNDIILVYGELVS
jgi:hypothetical protein